MGLILTKVKHIDSAEAPLLGGQDEADEGPNKFDVVRSSINGDPGVEIERGRAGSIVASPEQEMGEVGAIAIKVDREGGHAAASLRRRNEISTSAAPRDMEGSLGFAVPREMKAILASAAERSRAWMDSTMHYEPVIERLHRSYKRVSLEWSHYAYGPVSIEGEETINNNGFWGSATVVTMISSKGIIRHQGPGCIAAPVVNLVATKLIALGLNDEEEMSRQPARIYAPMILTMTAQEIVIGNLTFLEKLPKKGVISCKRLTLIQEEPEPSELVDVIRGWILHPKETKVNVVTEISRDE